MAIMGLGVAVLALGLLLGSLVGLAWLWWRVVRGGSGSALPSCGKCGYAARGVQSLACPECGADLREVGIVTPKAAGAIGVVGFVLLWTLFLPMPACVVSGVAMIFAPHHQTHSSSQTFRPESGGYQVELATEVQSRTSGGGMSSRASTRRLSGASASTVSTVNWGQPTPGQLPDSVELTITHAGSPFALELDPASGAGRYQDAQHQWHAVTDVDEQAMTAWFTSLNIDTTHADVQAEAAELAAAVADLRAGNATYDVSYFTTSGGSSSTYNGPAAWFGWMLGGIWLAIYAAGIAICLWIRRKRLRSDMMATVGAVTGMGTAM
ncbi:MAG: hypothetical protein WD534_07455 [Phycisphaeraceae bacterium]